MSSPPDLMKNLPDELVELIVKLADPLFTDPFTWVEYKQFYHIRRDMANLCLTSRQLRRFAIVRLYSRVGINSVQRLHQFLRSITRQPYLGKLARRAHLQWQSKASIDSQFPETAAKVKGDGVEDTDKDVNNQISALDEFYKAAVALELDSDFANAVKNGSESAAALLVLCFLPNLVILGLEPPREKGLLTKFDTYVGRRFLTQLEMVAYSHWDTEGGYPSQVLIPFLFLPSIRIISAHGVPGDRDNLGLQGKRSESLIETLNLHWTDMDLDTFTQLLQSCRCLKNISYDKRGDTDLVSTPLTRRGFANALLPTSHSLETLYVGWETYGFDDDDSFLGSLAHFVSLKKLSVGFADLLGGSPDSTSGSQLVEFLPPNLEELQLTEAGSYNLGRGQWQEGHYIEFSRQLLSAKKDSPTILKKLNKIYLPEKIVMCEKREEMPRITGPSRQLFDLATEVGVKLEVFDWNFGIIDKMYGIAGMVI